MSTPARLQQLIEPIVTGLGLVLYDLHYSGSVLSVVVDRPGAGVDLDALTAATRAVSRALDGSDPIAGRYQLEVTSPGLERTLRTPAHWAGAVGEQVSVKTVPAHEGPRRVRGELVAVHAEDPEPAVEVRDGDSGAVHRVPLADIERARTVFEWGPPPKPSKPKPARPGRRKGGSSETTTEADDKKVNAR